ncbi:MAG: diguanylate cyclase [Spirochaetaceae bacterium]
MRELDDQAARNPDELLEELSRFKGAIEAADHAIYFTDPTPSIIYVNPAFERLTGYAPGEVLGKNPSILSSGLQNDSYYQRLWTTVLAGNTWKEEVTNRRLDGTTYTAFQIISPIRAKDGEIRNFVAIQHDITRQKQIEEQLRHTLTEQTVIFDNTRDALFLLDVVDQGEFRYIKFNRAQEEVSGLRSEDVRGRRPEEILTGEYATEAIRRFRECLESRETVTYEETVPGQNGPTVWSTKLRPVIYEGRVIQIVGSGRDITEEKKLEAKLRRLSDADPLTGIYNRRKVMEELEREINRSLRYGHPLSLLMLDIDHFKGINDRFGHTAGDAVLTGFAETIKRRLRPTDIFGRWGGEEFLIILSETDLKGAYTLAERVRESIEDQAYLPELRATASIGVAALGAEVTSKDDLVNAADEALYCAKENGRNRVSGSCHD